MSLKTVIEIARGELGVTELPPGSNRVKYWDEYGTGWQGQPWCVCFLWWVFQHAGEGMAFFGGAKTAACSTLLNWYRQQGQGISLNEIQRGDIVFYNFSGSSSPQHVGIVISRAGNLVTCIEGNTSPGSEGSQDNGGCVAKKSRYIYQIVGAARPQYHPEPVPVPEPKDDISGHWAEADMRRSNKLGIIKGYPDGTFRPDKAVTRAEMAVIANRLIDLFLGGDAK